MCFFLSSLIQVDRCGSDGLEAPPAELQVKSRLQVKILLLGGGSQLTQRPRFDLADPPLVTPNSSPTSFKVNGSHGGLSRTVE